MQHFSHERHVERGRRKMLLDMVYPVCDVGLYNGSSGPYDVRTPVASGVHRRRRSQYDVIPANGRDVRILAFDACGSNLNTMRGVAMNIPHVSRDSVLTE